MVELGPLKRLTKELAEEIEYDETKIAEGLLDADEALDEAPLDVADYSDGEDIESIDTLEDESDEELDPSVGGLLDGLLDEYEE